MIKISELRIGNYFLNPKGEIEQVEGLLSSMQGEFINPVMDYSIEQLTGYKEEDCNPISLTPEKLERCGFEEKPHKLSRHFSNKSIGLLCSKQQTKEFIIAINGLIDMNMPYLLYLHQLQNLSFTLYAEELTVNNPHHDTL